MDERTKTETNIRKMNTFAFGSLPVQFSVAIYMMQLHYANVVNYIGYSLSLGHQIYMAYEIHYINALETMG